MHEDLLALDRVAAHDVALEVVQRARVVEDRAVDRELADVVQDGDQLDLRRGERVEPHVLGDPARELRQAMAVVGGRAVMGPQLGGEHADRPADPRIVRPEARGGCGNRWH